MGEISRRALLLGLGPLAALPAVKAKEWGTGRLVAWGRGEGIYESDDGKVSIVLLEHPWTIPVIPASLRKGARVDIAARKLMTRDGVVLDCAVGGALYDYA